MDQLTCYYYSIPTVKQLVSNKHHLYDVTIPKLLQSIKKNSLTGVSDTNNRCYSLCDDDVDDPTSDSDGLYASVSHPPPPFPSSTIGNNFVTQETLQHIETIVNVTITSTTTTNSNSMHTNKNMTGNSKFSPLIRAHSTFFEGKYPRGILLLLLLLFNLMDKIIKMMR